MTGKPKVGQKVRLNNQGWRTIPPLIENAEMARRAAGVRTIIAVGGRWPISDGPDIWTIYLDNLPSWFLLTSADVDETHEEMT